jgi:hypothetical protein
LYNHHRFLIVLQPLSLSKIDMSSNDDQNLSLMFSHIKMNKSTLIEHTLGMM